MHVFLEKGEIRTDCPLAAVFSDDGSVCAQVGLDVVFLLGAVLVLDLVDVSFPPGHFLFKLGGEK